MAVGIGGRCLRGAGVLAGVLLALASVGAGRAAGAAAATLRVYPSGCPYTQIGPALAAARNGDTIEVAAGTYRGGFTIGAERQACRRGCRGDHYQRRWHGADDRIIRGERRAHRLHRRGDDHARRGAVEPGSVALARPEGGWGPGGGG